VQRDRFCRSGLFGKEDLGLLNIILEEQVGDRTGLSGRGPGGEGPRNYQK
jgi:hypothetical protein